MPDGAENDARVGRGRIGHKPHNLGSAPRLHAILRTTLNQNVAESRAAVGASGRDELNDLLSKPAWLGAAERSVFNAFRSCAPYVSPFSIHNPDGWRYWLVHFATSYRARQVYNNVLHANSSLQAHFGKSGLNMLHYDPDMEGNLYLFGEHDREAAREQLHDDIPDLLSRSKDILTMKEFYESIYNMTPAHSNDVHAALVSNPDIQVTTSRGGERRSASAIRAEDFVARRKQRSFFQMFRELEFKRFGR